MSLFDYLERDDVPITTAPGPTELSAVEASPGDDQTGAGLSAKAGTDTADMVVAMEASPASDTPGNDDAGHGDHDRPEAEGREQSDAGEVPVRLFVSPEDLFAPMIWGTC